MARQRMMTRIEGKTVSARLRNGTRFKHQGISENEGKRGCAAFIRKKRKREKQGGQRQRRTGLRGTPLMMFIKHISPKKSDNMKPRLATNITGK